MEVSAPAGVLRSPAGWENETAATAPGLGCGSSLRPPAVSSRVLYSRVSGQSPSRVARRSHERSTSAPALGYAVARRSRKRLQCPARLVCGSSPAGARSACVARGPLHPESAHFEHEGTASLLVYTSVEQTLALLILYPGGRKGHIACLLPSVSGVDANEYFVSGIFRTPVYVEITANE